jgi:hypothetical protein
VAVGARGSKEVDVRSSVWVVDVAVAVDVGLEADADLDLDLDVDVDVGGVLLGWGGWSVSVAVSVRGSK